jgi:hypothetical protein
MAIANHAFSQLAAIASNSIEYPLEHKELSEQMLQDE